MSNGHGSGKWALYLALLALGLAAYATIVLHQGDDVWLNSECNGQLVGDQLSQIATMGKVAKDAGTLLPGDYDKLMAAIVQCALNAPGYGGTEAEHCASLQQALTLAGEDKWDLCIGELETGH